MGQKLIDTVTDIRYELKGELLEERSAELANLIKEKVDTQEEKASQNKIYNNKIKRIQTDIEKIGQDISMGFEIRSVACKKRKNFELEVWEYIDSHTREIIKTTPLESDDYQTSIDDYEE